MHNLYQKKLKYFVEARNKISDSNFIITDTSEIEKISKEWIEFISFQSSKGLIPLFITGSGVSRGDLSMKSDGTFFNSIPTIDDIIFELDKLLDQSQSLLQSEVKKLIDQWKDLKKHGRKDRTVVARLFDSLQNTKDSNRKKVWKDCNTKLLKTICLSEPSKFHKKLAILYEYINAVCLTLNFDGLLVKQLKNNGKIAFSLPTKEECENYFLRLTNDNEEQKKDFVEIQLRGDILYLKCDRKEFCPQKGRAPIPFINHTTKSNIEELILCPSCGEPMTPYLSFPGSYIKEKEMREMLQIMWKYLAFRVSSITVVGVSGDWDPLIIAFCGDLLNERDIPLLIVDPTEKITPIIRELIIPKQNDAIAIQTKADDFFYFEDPSTLPIYNNSYKMLLSHDNFDDRFRDHHWDNPKIINDEKLRVEVNLDIKEGFRVTDIEKELREKIYYLEKSAQLGLKTNWFGIDAFKENHDRLHHSLGVMKIASYLYDKAVREHGNDNEKQFLRIGALLHDVGHLPFSHLIEEVFNELNWIPGSYQTSYSHVLQTEKKIEEIFYEGSELEKKLFDYGYTSDDLIRLINGNFGVGYLDAIINSSIDADKIDYIFADTDATKRKISLSDSQFLKDITYELKVTPEKLLAFSGISAKAAFELLNARRHLYQNLYLLPSIRILESVTKHIITSYFINELNFLNDDSNNEILRQIHNKRYTNYPDLGFYKIIFCIKQIEKLQNEYTNSDNLVTEFKVLDGMYKSLMKNRFLNKDYKNSIKNGYELIKIKGESKLKELETKIQIYSFDNFDLYEKMLKISKTCKLRMPGVLIIDVVKIPKFLSLADERKKKLRSDDTESFSECMIVPSGKCESWYASQNASMAFLDSGIKDEEKKGFNVYIYPILDVSKEPYENPKIKQAMNLFYRLREQANITFETE